MNFKADEMKDVEIQVSFHVECGRCDGTGEDLEDDGPCHNCDGAGKFGPYQQNVPVSEFWELLKRNA